MLAAMGAFWFFVFLAPTSVKWLAFIVGIFAFGVWVGRQTMKRE